VHTAYVPCKKMCRRISFLAKNSVKLNRRAEENSAAKSDASRVPLPSWIARGLPHNPHPPSPASDWMTMKARDTGVPDPSSNVSRLSLPVPQVSEYAVQSHVLTRDAANLRMATDQHSGTGAASC